jgi:RNA polymerase sigma-70 factor (ECF subfamily)
VAVIEPSTDDRTESPARPGFNEAELVRRAQLGSTAAFEQLVLARGPQLHRYLVVRLRDEADALDALQETFTAAWLGLPSLKAATKFWPWVVGIAAHKAVDAVRRRIPTTQPDEPSSADETGAVEVRAALAALPEHFREILLVRYLLQLSEEEAAEALGIRVGTVKSRSARARKALEERLR